VVGLQKLFSHAFKIFFCPSVNELVPGKITRPLVLENSPVAEGSESPTALVAYTSAEIVDKTPKNPMSKMQLRVVVWQVKLCKFPYFKDAVYPVTSEVPGSAGACHEM
jgi:hypothetical protein